MPDISNMNDLIDSRDIIERIEELREEREDFEHDEDGNLTGASWADSNPTEAEELATLEKLAAECEAYADDWEYGVALIRDSYFTGYVQELLEDCGDLPRGLPHYIEIDWEATARNIRVDYTSVDFDGVTYWIR